MAAAQVKAGIDVVTLAAEHDRAGRAAEALNLYRVAVEQFFEPALASGLDDATAKLVRQKAATYRDRADELAAEVGVPAIAPGAFPTPPSGSSSSSGGARRSSSSRRLKKEKKERRADRGEDDGPPGASVRRAAAASPPLREEATPSVMNAAPAVDWSSLQQQAKAEVAMSAPPAVDWTAMQKQVERIDIDGGGGASSTSSALFRILEEAYDAQKLAHTAETEKDYPGALRAYHTCCAKFLEALEQEKNEDTLAEIRRTVEINMARAELIKRHLSSRGAGSSDAIRRSAPAGSRGGTLNSGTVAPKAAAQPQALEVTQDAAPFVSVGLESFSEAKAADQAGDYATATARYDAAVAAFTQARLVESNQHSKKLLNDQMVSCMQRSETLKALMTTGSVVGMIPMTGAAKADGGKPGSYKAPKVKIDKKAKKTWRKG